MQRGSMRSGGVVLAALLMVCTGPIQAAQGAAGDQADQTQQEPPTTARQQGQGTRKPAAKPADSFKPTEKIRADSAVSFPVDI